MKKGLFASAAVIAAFAAAPSAQAACGLTDCQQVTGTVASALSLTASTPVTLTNNGTPGSLSTGTAAAPATGSGTVAVISTDQYCVTIKDANATGGLLTNLLGAGSGQFTQPIQWALGAGPLSALGNTAANFAINQSGTLGRTYTVNYNQTMANQFAPSGAYAVTAQFIAVNC